MAVTLPATGSGDATPQVATDSVGGVHYQWVKLQYGAAGAVTAVDAANPLPTTLPLSSGAAGAALPSKVHQIGGSDGANLRALLLDSTGKVLLASSKAEDSASADGDLVIPAGFVRNDANATLTGTDGDYGWAVIDNKGRLRVVVDTALPTGANTIGGVTDGGGSLTVDSPQLPTLASGRLPVDGSGVTQPVSAAALPLPSGAAQEHVTAASPHAVELSDGAAFYVGAKTGQLPSALVSGRLSVDASAVAVPITDNAGSLTVDAPLATPVGVQLSDGAAGYTGVKTGQLPAALVGSRLDVNVGAALPTGANVIGAVTGSGTFTVDSEFAAAVLAADGMSLPTSPEVLAANQLSNGTTLDLQRGNVEGTALASAARTATISSANITNHNARGVMVFLNVTAASGTGGLQTRIRGVDPVGASSVAVNALPTAIIATSLLVYVVYPGGGAGALTQGTNVELPRTFFIQVVHGDTSSYTYSVSYALLV